MAMIFQSWKAPCIKNAYAIADSFNMAMIFQSWKVAQQIMALSEAGLLQYGHDFSIMESIVNCTDTVVANSASIWP